MQRRFAVCNQKGGVAKSTSAVNIAVILAQMGRKVLLVDYDPQGNASQFLGLIDELDDEGLYTSANLTRGDRPFAPQSNCLLPGLDLVPASDSLAELEFDLLQDTEQGAYRLGTALSAVAQAYEYILIDCPPTLGMLAINALMGASNVIIPVKLSPASVPGALRLHNTLERLRPSNAYLRVVGVFGTFLSEAARAPREVLEQLRGIFGSSAVFDTAIHAAQGIDDASGKGAPVVLTAPRSRAADEYRSLTNEVIARV